MTADRARKHPVSISWPIHPALNSQWVSPSRSHDNGVSRRNSWDSVDEKRKECSGFSIIFNNWTTDILACFVACLALMAIVVTLATHDARALPNWKFGITVNALVSVFATIWKAAMLKPVSSAVSQLKWSWFRQPRPLVDIVAFDEASRGVMGSFWLIGRLRAMHLASLGAIICILALASDPFIQQIVKFDGCARAMANGTASIPRTNVYADFSIVTAAGQHTIGYAMQAALFNGAFDSFSPNQPTCTTGNCTFGEFRSIGMCGGCMDVSKDLTVKCHGLEGPPGKACRWKLPSGLGLTIPNNRTKTMVMTSVEQAYALAIAYGVAASTDIISLTNVLGYNQDTEYPWEDILQGGEQNLMGLQCSLWPCVRTYNATMIGNEARETVLTTHNMTFNASDPSGSFVATPMPCLLNGTYHEASAFREKNAMNTNEVLGLLPTNESVWLPDQCLFAYTNPLGLFDHFPSLLSGFASTGFYGSFADPSWVGELFHNDSATLASVGQTWTNIADSITVHMRAAGMAGRPTFNAPAEGQVWSMETCIAVRWPWLAFPAALLALTIALLVATIVESTRHDSGRIWKASPLALLFHGIQPELYPDVRHVHEEGAMMKVARRLIASVEEDGDGVGLQGALQAEEKDER